MLHYIQCSPMNKLCGAQARNATPYDQTYSLKWQHIYFQIVLWSDSPRPVTVKMSDCSTTFNDVYLIKNVPVSFPHFADDADQNYITNDTAVIPDCLIPLAPDDIITVGNTPTLLWVTARSHFKGEYKISYQFTAENESITTLFKLKTVDRLLLTGRCKMAAAISPHSITANEVFPAFTNLFWEHLSRHFSFAVKQGITNIITPLFSTPESETLDRSPDQLLRIKMVKNKYEFDYGALDSWLIDGARNGIEEFTFTPLFPSMIDRRCPRVYAEGDRKRYLIFSEENDILSNEYIDFICKMLRKLVKHLGEIGLRDKVTFIMTKEITPEYADIYSECFTQIKYALSGQKIISYMSQLPTEDFKGFPTPIVPMGDVAPYAVYPFGPKISFDINRSDGFMNQLIATPSMRIGSFGILCYLYNFSGIILDHYNCNISPITGKNFDPLLSPDGDGAYPAGSLFMVYNHSHGPYSSIRLHLLRAAIQDSVVLFLLEDYIPRERIIAMIERELSISSDRYLNDIGRYHKFMEKVYALYEKHIEKEKKK